MVDGPAYRKRGGYAGYILTDRVISFLLADGDEDDASARLDGSSSGKPGGYRFFAAPTRERGFYNESMG